MNVTICYIKCRVLSEPQGHYVKGWVLSEPVRCWLMSEQCSMSSVGC